MKSIITYIALNKRIANIFLTIIILTGFLTIINLPKQLNPTLQLNYINILTVYPNQSPETIEKTITNKIEDNIKSIKKYKTFRSISTDTHSRIILEILDGIDKTEYKNEIQEKVDKITDFPSDLKNKPIVSFVSSDDRAFILGISHKSKPYKDLHKQAKALQKHILNITGVLEASIEGIRKPKLMIDLNLDRLTYYKITISDVIEKLKRQNIVISIGNSNTLNKKNSLEINQELTTVEDLKNVIIRSTFSSRPIYLEEIANIYSDFEDEKTKSLINGKAGIALHIKKIQNQDIFELEKDILTAIQSFNNNSDIKVDVLFNSVRYLTPLYQAVSIGFIAAMIAVLIILSLILDIQTAFWTALGIPFSILFCFIFFGTFNITFHFIILFTFIMVTGMLVDDAIIVAENIYRLKEEGLSNLEATIQGSYQMFKPILAIISTTILGFLPIFFLPGPLGMVLNDMPKIVALCLIGSLLECFLILPAHLLLVKKRTKKSPLKRLLDRCSDLYKKSTQLMLSFKAISSIGFILLFGGLLILYFSVGSFQFISKAEPELFEIQFELKNGSSLEASHKKNIAINRLLEPFLKEEKITAYLAKTGSKFSMNQLSSSSSEQTHFATTYGFFPNIQNTKHNLEEVVDEMRTKILALQDEFEDLRFTIIYGGPPVEADIKFNLISQDNPTRLAASRVIQEQLKNIKGIEQITHNETRDSPTIQIHIDYEACAKQSVDPSHIGILLRSAYTGFNIPGVRIDDEDVDYLVRLEKSFRTRWKNIQYLQVQNKYGALIPLSQLITYKKITSNPEIFHSKGKRATSIQADINTKKIKTNTAINLLKKHLDALKVQFPDIDYELEGAIKSDAESFAGLLKGFIISMICIYFILCLLFNSFIQPVLMMIVIPLLFIGVAGIRTLHMLPMSFSSIIGCLGAMGVVLNDSVVMTNSLNKMLSKHQFSIKEFSKTTQTRFRPIVLTSLTTTITLFPVAYKLPGVVVSGYLVNMAFSLMWGIIVGTIVTLYVIPLLYKFLANSIRRITSPKQKTNQIIEKKDT